MEGRAVGMEPERQPWKATIGNWRHWTDPTGTTWNAVDIVTYQGKTSATFLSRRAPDQEQTEHFRAIYFAKVAKLLPLPYNIGGKQKIQVYWYDATSDEGPFVRLSDRWGEYLVDLSHNRTEEIIRFKGRAFVGDIRPGEDHSSWSGDSDKMEVSINGRPARELTGPVAAGDGQKVGEISGY
jgi:hypothetical protein